jgi:hypothetical protein
MSVLTGASIDFDVRRPNIRLNVDEYTDRRSWGIAFELYFARRWGETIRVTTEEEELRNLDGRVGFAVMDDGTPEGERGQLYYSEGSGDLIHGYPPSYSVSLWVTQGEHDRLIALVQNGVALTKLSIDTGEGVEYGWEPDGKGKDWDNKQFPKVTVRGFNLQFGTDEDDVLDEDVEAPKSILDEPGPPDTFKKDALAKLNDVSTRLGWLLALLIFAIAVVAVRR